MRKAFVTCLTLLVAVSATSAFARPPAETPRILQGADITERPTLADPKLATEASSDTFVFGPYDYETGLAGWSPVDFTLNPTTYAHTVDLSTVPGSLGNGTTFTGRVVWIGELGSNACGTKACFPGYINGANQLMFKSYAVPSVSPTLTFQYRNQTEATYDFTRIIVAKNGVGCPTPQGSGIYSMPGTDADRDTLVVYTGDLEGSGSFSLSAYSGTTVCIIIHAVSDAGYSDEDCNNDTSDGLFEIDNVAVSGSATSTFETGDDGWTFGRGSGVGSFVQVEPLSGLPNADPCPAFCGLAGNVITMYDATNPIFHPDDQNAAIISPTLDLTANAAYPVGAYVVQFDVYANLALANGNFYFWHVRYQPVEIANCSCLDPTDWSPWLDENTIYYGGGTPSCGTGFQFNVSAKVPGHAQRLQMAIGVLNYDFYQTTPGGNQSPYFDNVSLRAAKVSAPAVVRGPWDYLQDAYPNASSFATAKSTAAKIDAGLNVFSPNRRRTRLGDTAIANVALSCNSDQATEVDVLLKVVPGPCLNTSHPWWVAYSAQPTVASGKYAGFVVARMDTAISATNSNAATSGFGTFMGEFHESPPAVGTTYAGLGNWGGYTGGAEGTRIFPDDLFTPGTHIYWVIHTTYIPVKTNGDYYSPDKYGDGDGDRMNDLLGNMRWASDGGTYDPSATFVEETAILPFTTQDGNTGGCATALPKDCFLYVDRWDQRGPQPTIQAAFRNLKITWDRYDVRAPTSAMGNDLGSRFDPLNYANGDHAPGPLPALLNEVYKAILWQTGTNNSTNFTYGITTGTPDAGNAVGMLDQWLRTTTDGKYLWVSGDGNSRFLHATGARLTFLNTTLGTTLVGAQYRDVNSTWGVTLTGQAGGSGCSAGLLYGLRANWCPQRRSFNTLGLYAVTTGTNHVNFRYPDVSATQYNAAIEYRAHAGGLNFDTENDAWSLEQLVQNPPPTSNGPTTNYNVTNWAAKALSVCFTGCFTGLDVVAVGDGKVLENSLLSPGVAVGGTHIDFSLKQAGNVTIRVYDVSGRLVSTVVDSKKYEAGPSSVPWNTAGLRGGVYFYQIEASGFKSAKKIVLVN